MTWRIHRFPILASTNDLALEWVRAGTADVGDVVVAAEQTAGRGRPGRSWHSPRGALLMSAVLPFHPARVGWTALAAGLAAAEAARDLGAPAGVKWPNDVVIGARKLAGVLAEASVPGLVVVGIGMNVSNPAPDDPELAARSARLVEYTPEAGVDTVLDALLERLAARWELLAAAEPGPLRRAWEALDTTAGRRLLWSESRAAGIAEGVDDAGALRLRAGDGRLLTAVVGEVTFLD